MYVGYLVNLKEERPFIGHTTGLGLIVELFAVEINNLSKSRYVTNGLIWFLIRFILRILLYLI